jgi:hypothetical protein
VRNKGWLSSPNQTTAPKPLIYLYL